jgi:hypothetical protein
MNQVLCKSITLRAEQLFPTSDLTIIYELAFNH